MLSYRRISTGRGGREGVGKMIEREHMIKALNVEPDAILDSAREELRQTRITDNSAEYIMPTPDADKGQALQEAIKNDRQVMTDMMGQGRAMAHGLLDKGR